MEGKVGLRRDRMVFIIEIEMLARASGLLLLLLFTIEEEGAKANKGETEWK